MTEPKAWHCPNCNAYHAPHVETCPKPGSIAGGRIGTGWVDQMAGRDDFSLEAMQKRAAAQAVNAMRISQLLGDQRVGVTVGTAPGADVAGLR